MVQDLPFGIRHDELSHKMLLAEETEVYLLKTGGGNCTQEKGVRGLPSLADSVARGF
jgi:hypothetical protein